MGGRAKSHQKPHPFDVVKGVGSCVEAKKGNSRRSADCKNFEELNTRDKSQSSYNERATDNPGEITNGEHLPAAGANGPSLPSEHSKVRRRANDICQQNDKVELLLLGPFVFRPRRNKSEKDACSGKGYKSEGQQNVSKVTDLMNMRTHHSECT